MIPSLRSFDVENISSLTDGRGVVGVVKFRFDSELGERATIHEIAITVRAIADMDTPLQKLHEALFDRALEVVNETLELSRGRTFSDMRSTYPRF